MTTILIAGATGLVGRAVLSQALANPAVTRIVAATRRPLGLEPHARGPTQTGGMGSEAVGRVENPIVDFDALPDAAWWGVDAVICTLGTTRKAAGSAAAFRKVDFDYVLAVAKSAKAHGAKTFVLTTSVGAKASSHFLYLRTKGEIEAAIAALGFGSFTIVRPAGLVGAREKPRGMEKFANGLTRAVSLVVPRRYRPVAAERVAKTLLAAALGAAPGQHVVESEAILR